MNANVVPFRTPANDDATELGGGGSGACEAFRADINALCQSILDRIKGYEEGYRPGSDVFAYRDQHRLGIDALYSDITNLNNRVVAAAKKHGIPEVAQPILGQLKPLRQQFIDRVKPWLETKRPEPPKPTHRSQDFQRLWANDPTPPKKNDWLGWGGPVRMFLGIGICLAVILFCMVGGGGIKPYGWGGMHNGHFSSGYGLRLGHHRN